MTEILNIIAVGLLLGGVYSLVSVGLNLIFGVIRIVNFAQGEFVMLGMYGAFAAQVALHMDPYVAVVLVTPALFLLGAAVYGVILRPLGGEPMMQIFATFGLLMVLQNVDPRRFRRRGLQRRFRAFRRIRSRSARCNSGSCACSP